MTRESTFRKRLELFHLWLLSTPYVPPATGELRPRLLKIGLSSEGGRCIRRGSEPGQYEEGNVSRRDPPAGRGLPDSPLMNAGELPPRPEPRLNSEAEGSAFTFPSSLVCVRHPEKSILDGLSGAGLSGDRWSWLSLDGDDFRPECSPRAPPEFSWQASIPTPRGPAVWKRTVQK